MRDSQIFAAMDGAHDAPAAAPAPHAAGAAPAATKPPGTKVFDSSLRYAAGMEHRPTDSTTAYDIDIEALADKPWRRAGADISDYFNYGFNERTWVVRAAAMLRSRALSDHIAFAPAAARSQVYAATMRQMRAQAEEQVRRFAAPRRVPLARAGPLTPSAPRPTRTQARQAAAAAAAAGADGQQALQGHSTHH